MKKAKDFIPFMLVIIACVLAFFLIMQPLTILQFSDKIPILFPKGDIALQQRNLLFIIQAIMLLVVIPVYILTFLFSWKYRAQNKKATYDPDLIDNTLAEYIWWGLPLLLTLVVSVLTWVKTYELDPFKPLDSDRKPLTIQVVALQWKWLFIYPQENIASVNFFQFPKDVPLHFEITADAPMNSFWIPDLGGQIYAMPKMKTQLNLIANQLGDFRGSSANLSGEGFAEMYFIARATTDEEYLAWVGQAKASNTVLDRQEYEKLVKPSIDYKKEIYTLKDQQLFDQIVMKYMEPDVR